MIERALHLAAVAGGVSAIDPVRLIPTVAWLICLAALLPPMWRMVHRRGRYLDPVWGVVFLLAGNRLTYLLRVNVPFSHLTAAALALVMAYFTLWYQRNDRRS